MVGPLVGISKEGESYLCAIIRKLIRQGFKPSNTATFDMLCSKAVETLFATILTTRAYSNVQLDTKCVVGKEICAVKNQIFCSYCINEFCRESVKFRDNSPGFI